MASKTLYPPIIPSKTNAFVANNKCRVYFSLSKLSSTPVKEIKDIHISIVKQNNNMNVIKNNIKMLIFDFANNVQQVEGVDNYYYVDIENILDNGKIVLQWVESWIYKIQIRLSTVSYSSSNIKGQEFFSNYANNISEWSNITITKAIGENSVSFPVFNYEYDLNKAEDENLFASISTLDLYGIYSNKDMTEKIYSYYFSLFDNNDMEIETSPIIYNVNDSNELHYLFKHELKNNIEYKIIFNITTNNNYSFSDSFIFLNQQNLIEPKKFRVYESKKLNITEQEDNGVICLNIKEEHGLNYSGSICLRRTDSTSNFTNWIDIQIFNLNDESEVKGEYYDYSIESGVIYKYAIQTVNVEGVRSVLYDPDNAIKFVRYFQYSFILGENNKQLCLKFNNTMNSYQYVVGDSKVETLGGKYPIITRNSSMHYRSFPINGLISFNMDEYNTFIKNKIYSNNLYDNTEEREFRENVLAFLTDGKPKLYKSPTEGNILVRLMDVNTTPEQSLNRLIYSFSCNAIEIDECNYSNYIKYHICNDIIDIKKNLLLVKLF